MNLIHAPGAVAPMSNLSEEARRKMAAIGPVWGKDLATHRQIVFETYTPMLAEMSEDGIHVTRDVAYGADPRQTMDVYQPDGGSGMPVVMFIHGGAFVRGAKNMNQQIYGNVPRYFARKGLLGINMEYRLAPEAAYPEGSRDIAQAVAWARSNAGEYGGDPERIYLVGHSAGGTHAATYVGDPCVRPAGGPGIAGLVLISARLRIDVLPDNPNADPVRAYYGDDPALYEARSAVTHAANIDVPTFIAVAEFENPWLDVYGAELFHRLAKLRGRAPRFLQMPRHNHISMVAHFDTSEEILGRAILEFIETGF